VLAFKMGDTASPFSQPPQTSVSTAHSNHRIIPDRGLQRKM
jgi:hypothetical protein